MCVCVSASVGYRHRQKQIQTEIDMESSINKLIKNISAELNFGLWAIIMLALFDLKSVQLN